MDPKLITLRSQVRQLLFEFWDPIGFGEHGVPPDEYYPYVLPICSMLMDTQERAIEDFVDFLQRSEKNITGMPLNMDRIKKTSEQLMALRLEVRSS